MNTKTNRPTPTYIVFTMPDGGVFVDQGAFMADGSWASTGMPVPASDFINAQVARVAALESALNDCVNIIDLGLGAGLWGDESSDEHDSAEEVSATVETARDLLNKGGA